MGQNQTDFQPQSVAVLSDGSQVVPENAIEESFLTNVANSNHSPEQKERITRMGTLFEPNKFDVNFSNTKRASLPNDLDPQIRQLIKEV